MLISSLWQPLTCLVEQAVSPAEFKKSRTGETACPTCPTCIPTAC